MKVCVKYTYEDKEYVTLPNPPEVMKYSVLEKDKKTQSQLQTLYSLMFYSMMPTLEDAVVTPVEGGHYVSGTVHYNGKTYKMDTMTTKLELVETDDISLSSPNENGEQEVPFIIGETPLADSPQEAEVDEVIKSEEELDNIIDHMEQHAPEPLESDSEELKEQAETVGDEWADKVVEETVENDVPEPDPALSTEEANSLVNETEEEVKSETLPIDFFKPDDPAKYAKPAMESSYTVPHVGVYIGAPPSPSRKFNSFNVGFTKKVSLHTTYKGKGSRTTTPLPTYSRVQEPVEEPVITGLAEEAIEVKPPEYEQPMVQPASKSVLKKPEPIHVIIDPPEEEQEETLEEPIVTNGIPFKPVSAVDSEQIGDIANVAEAYCKELSEEDIEILERIPIELFGSLAEYTTDDIDADMVLRDGRDYCINNHWHVFGEWFAIDQIREMKRYFYCETEQIFTSITYQTKVNWFKVHGY